MWDALGRLKEVRQGSQTVAAYSYDIQNRRFRKTVGTETTYYLYNLDDQLIAEISGSGTVLREYVWLEGEPFVLCEYTGANAGNYFYLNDHLGTPQRLVNGQTGAVAWQAAYLPFGEAQVSNSSTVTNNLRFPGQYFDAETGLHYNWNRYYDPASGRYVSADPIGLEGGLNLYEYARNNSINNIDFMGLKSCTQCDECPCGTWSVSGKGYGGFMAVFGAYTVNISLTCDCSDITKDISLTCGRAGVGLGGDISVQWMKIWGVCNSNEIQWGGAEAIIADGKFIVGGSIGASGGIENGSFSWSGGFGLGANVTLWSKCILN